MGVPTSSDARLFYRCAGTWSATGDDCRRLRPIPVLKDPPPVANLEGEAPSLAPSSRRFGAGIADPAVARAAMIADAEAISRLRQRHSVADEARAMKQMADAMHAGMPGERPMPRPLDDYLAFVRSRR